MKYPPILEPASYTAAAGDIAVTISGTAVDRPRTTIQHRSVALVFETRSGEQVLVPLSAANAVRLGHDLLREGNDAANAFEHELETIEVEVTLDRREEAGRG